MLILSQHKIVILNFNTTTTIIVDNNEIIARLVNGNKATLGKYDTEERAKEVLQEIIQAYSQEDFYHIRKSQINEICSIEEPKFIIKPITRPKVYEMPEK